jgi:ferritin-like metal-binding protein YciE
MPLTRIRELYVVELSEIYETEQEILRQLPLMAARSGSNAVRDAFEVHYRTTLRQVDRLLTIFDSLEERRRPGTAPAIRGLVEEARLRQAFLDRGHLLDLALVTMGRRMEHYEMAAYSAAVAYAHGVEDVAGASLLIETLDEERRMDEALGVLTPTPHAQPRITAV